MQAQSRQLLRQSIRQQRNQLSTAQQRQHARALARQFQGYRTFQNAQHIGAYLANNGEIDLTFLIKNLWKQRHKCYLPRLHHQQARQMDFIRYQPNSRLLPNRFGILEPCNQKHQIALKKLDIVLVPLVAFDAYGNRLGMGGGYYDHTFRHYKQRFNRQAPKLIGVAHSFQQVAQLTAYHWDIPLDAIITEKAIIQRTPHAY